MATLTDSAWRDLLPEYLALKQRGERPGRHWRDFEAHAANSPECAAELAELARLMDDLGRPELLPAPATAPDLWFLPNRPRRRALAALADYAIGLSKSVLAGLSGPQLAGGLRGVQSLAQRIPASGDAPEVLIEIDVARGAADATVRVTIGDLTMAERDGVPVLAETPQRAIGATTDEQGCAVFDIPVAELPQLTLRFA